MAKGSAGSIARQIKTLWTGGAIGDADDQALLALFSARRDETGDTAFRVLVERHGPMVVRVCRQVLGDDHDGHDAAQAVFLVLARKAGSIHHRGSIAPWLHGVACRVAAKARRRMALRRVNETRAVSARLQTVATVAQPHVDWEAIHDEVARLPEKYRAPVVLCYLEGQTYEETARRLGCPVGTVRVRLSRARDRLRDRLRRRGFDPLAFVTLPSFETFPPTWVESTIRASNSFINGRAIEAGTVSASTLTLSQGVLWSMTLTKWKLAAAGLLTIGSLAAAGSALVGQEPAPKGAGATGKTVAQADDPATTTSRKRQIALRLARSAREQMEMLRAIHQNGQVTIDRFIDASRQLMRAETRVATSRDQRIEAARAHLKRMSEAVQIAEARHEAARGTALDVVEATQARDLAELDVIDAEKSGEPGELSSTAEPHKETGRNNDPAPRSERGREFAANWVKEAQQMLDDNKKLLFGGEIKLHTYLESSRTLMEAESRLNPTREGRVAAAEGHRQRMSESVKFATASFEKGIGTRVDIAEAESERNQAELKIIDAQNSGGSRDHEALERRVTALEEKLDRVIKLLSLTAPGLMPEPVPARPVRTR